MITLESLNRNYERITNWQDQYRQSLMEFLSQSLAFCENGEAELSVKYKNWSDAEEEGVEFADQFPISITIEDRHGFQHSIYVTKVYKRNDLFYVDGYDNYDNKWIEGWYTDDSNSTYEDLAYFINQVLNSETDTETPVEVEADNGFVPQLIGYQLLDEEDCYPSELGAWDVFATREDAEEYRQTMLDANEWRIVEEWSTPDIRPSKYRYRRSENRSFEKDEKVWIEETYETYATLCESYEKIDSNERVILVDLEDGMKFSTNADNLYKPADKKCGFCGSTLYINHKDDMNFKYFCPECKEKYKE